MSIMRSALWCMALLLLPSACGHPQRPQAAQSPGDRCWQTCYQECNSQVRSEHIPCTSRCNEQCSGCSLVAGVERYCACVAVHGGDSSGACKNKERQVVSLSPGPPVQARVKQVTGSRESPMVVTASLVFSNASARAVEVARYKLLWPGGSVLLEPRDLRIPPLGALERSVRINPDAGDLRALLKDPSAARVELIETGATH